MYNTAHKNTVEPPNKGHVGDNINSAVVFFVERLSSFGDLKCIRSIGKHSFWTLNCVLCREVYYTVSLSRRVHYRCIHAPIDCSHSTLYNIAGNVGGL